MTLQEIYNNLNVIIKKEVRGNRMKPQEFNYVLESANEAFFKRKLDSFIRIAGEGMKDGDLDSRFMESFLVTSTGNSLTTGELDLSDIEATVFDIAAILSVKGTYSSAFRKIDYVTPQRAQEALHNLMGHRLTSYPLCYRVGSSLHFLPQDVTSVDVTYAKWPDVPVLDYYIDTSGDVQYFDEGDGAHVWTTGEIDSSGTTHTTGDANWTVLTKELDYEPVYHYEFMMDCLAQYGMSLENINLINYAEGKKQEVNQR